MQQYVVILSPLLQSVMSPFQLINDPVFISITSLVFYFYIINILAGLNMATITLLTYNVLQNNKILKIHLIEFHCL